MLASSHLPTNNDWQKFKTADGDMKGSNARGAACHNLLVTIKRQQCAFYENTSALKRKTDYNGPLLSCLFSAAESFQLHAVPDVKAATACSCCLHVKGSNYTQLPLMGGKLSSSKRHTANSSCCHRKGRNVGRQLLPSPQ